MEVVYECCCGLDVHAKTVVACLVTKGHKEIRTFATMTDELLQLGEWLSSAGCTHVAIESTGGYWKPVCNLLAVSSPSFWSTRAIVRRSPDARRTCARVKGHRHY